MPASPTELLHEWHDFFLLVGTASATQCGADRPVVLRAGPDFGISAAGDIGGAVAHAGGRKCRCDCRRPVDIAPCRHPQRLGHDAVDRDQDAIEPRTFALSRRRHGQRLSSRFEKQQEQERFALRIGASLKDIHGSAR